MLSLFTEPMRARQRAKRARTPEPDLFGGPAGSTMLRPFASVLGRRGSYTLPRPYPDDVLLSQDSQFESLGLHSREAAAFQTLADRHHFEIFVRTGHVSRTANVGRPGLRPKPAGVYQKTNKGAFASGLVVYPKSQAAKAQADLHAINHPDPEHATHSARVLATEELSLCPLGPDMQGLCDGKGNLFYGDIDIHGVYARDETGAFVPVDGATFVPLFNADLTATGLHAASLLEPGTKMEPKDFGVLPHSPIQHGAHDEWSERNNASYAGGVNLGPLPGVIRFRPRMPVQHVATVAHYRDILASFEQKRVYTGEAWSHGINRLAPVRYTRRNSSQSAGGRETAPGKTGVAQALPDRLGVGWGDSSGTILQLGGALLARRQRTI